MSEKMLVNLNGQILEPHKAQISVFDRGFLYGDSIYEVTMLIDRVPFMIEAHMDRLERSAQKMALTLPLKRQEIIEQTLKTAHALGVKKSYVRIMFTRGVGEITLDPTTLQQANFLVIAKELLPNPDHWYRDGVWMVVADTLRNHTRAIDPSVKSGNYLNNVMAMGEAKRAGAFDAIMLNHQGNVTEGTTSNIWIVEGDRFITAPTEAGILDGITRQSLLKIPGFKMFEENFSPERMKKADEVFLTSTTKEIVPIVKIDQCTIGNGQPGGYTKKLHQAYQELMKKHLADEKVRLNI
jgi:branched-chain amino acid aminotransferase